MNKPTDTATYCEVKNKPIKVVQGETAGVILAQLFALVVIVSTWLSGIVIAKGFWSTACAIFPPYAWYLLIERLLQMYGVV